MRRVRNRWKKKQAGRIVRAMTFVKFNAQEGFEKGVFPMIILSLRYRKFIVKFRNKHKYNEHLFFGDRVHKYYEKQMKRLEDKT